MTECRNNLAQDIAQDIEGQRVFELERQLEFLNPLKYYKQVQLCWYLEGVYLWNFKIKDNT